MRRDVWSLNNFLKLYELCDDLLMIIDMADYNKPESVVTCSENSFKKIEEIRKIVYQIKGVELS